MSRRLYLVAGEASGDVLGQDAAAAILKRDPSIVIRATGVSLNQHMSDISVEPLSVLGIWEGVQAYGAVKRIVTSTVEDILAFRPDVAVLIDSWGFTLRVADAVRKADPNIRIVKLVGPQVWATRPGRAKALAEKVDHLLCIHDFEVPYYEPFGLRTTVIGHPALARSEPGDGAAFRDKHGLGDKAPLIAVFPGSRPSEIARMGSHLVEACKLASDRKPGVQFAFAPSGSIASEFWAIDDFAHPAFVRADPDDRFDLMAASDVALACSGTITTEIALQGTPVITGYRSGVLTWFIATRFLLTSKYITLLNVAADKEIVPEFLQYDFNAERLARTVEDLLTDETARTAQIAAQNAALQKMGLGNSPAADIAAAAILEELGSARAGV
ncbi:MAG: lipid-A-disaccharide synthase [Pseudomonadota bacterium]